jgi:hypothetical protein
MSGVNRDCCCRLERPTNRIAVGGPASEGRLSKKTDFSVSGEATRLSRELDTVFYPAIQQNSKKMFRFSLN